MKIAFIGEKDIHKLGGIESYMNNLCTELVKLGHTPIVFCESDNNREEVVNGFRVIYIKGPKSVFVRKPICSLKATLRIIFKMRDIDLIHYNTMAPATFSFVACLGNKKHLVQSHGLEWQRTKYSGTQQKLLKLWEAYAVVTNRNFITCSESQVKYFKDKYHKRSVAIPTAVYLPKERENSSVILENYNLESKKFFLFMGRLVQDKNPDYLIKAFNEVEYKGIKLVIAGSNDADKGYVEYLHNLAKDNPNVVFTGAVYNEDKDALLRNAYCFCIPSTIEGLSIALFEAMSYKLPCIASDIDANHESLENYALWVKPENKEDLRQQLKYVIDNPQVLQQFVEINYQRVKDNYTWPIVTNKYVEYVHSLGIK